MEEKKDTPPPIIDQLKEYAETRLKLAKYEAIDKSTEILSSMIMDVVIAISLILTFLFLSFSFAFYMSDLLGSKWEGFGCTALLYLLIALIIYLTKDKLQKPLVNLPHQKIILTAMDLSIKNSSDLKAEIIRLRSLKNQQESAISARFSGPSALFHTFMSLFPNLLITKIVSLIRILSGCFPGY